MSRKSFVLIIVAALLASVFLVAFKPLETNAGDTITIGSDGSIDPPSAPISNADNQLYTFLDNINDSIAIYRSNIILDGANYTLGGTGSSSGVYFSNRKNVTIRNLHITDFSNGIYLNNSTDCLITGNIVENVSYAFYVYQNSNFANITQNSIVSNGNGVYVRESSNCTISGNNITCVRADNKFGVYLLYSTDNTINANMITQSQAGIYAYSSSHNALYDNNITNSGSGQDGGGIWLDQSSFNSLYGNYLAENWWHGIELYKSSNNSVSGNEIDSNSNRGIMIHSVSSYNSVVGNNIVNNYKGIEIASSSQHNDVCENNLTANDNGAIILDYSWNNTICRNNLVDNNSGMLIGDHSDYNNITENTIVDGGNGINLVQVSYNNVLGNNLTNNTSGITIQSSSENMFRNNIMNNNTANFCLLASSQPTFFNDVDDTNLVNSQPIYYWTNTHDSDVPQNASCVILVNCTGIIVQNMNLSSNNWQGVVLAQSSNVTVANSYITTSEYGIWLWNSSECHINRNYLHDFVGIQLAFSSNNTIYGNNITGSGNWGSIGLVQSSNNTFYGNNFTDNYIHVLIDGMSVNSWDNGYGDNGNYWDNYEDRYSYAKDEKSGPYQNEDGSDGVWDNPYTLNEGNVDNYPVVFEFPSSIFMVLSLILTASAAILVKKKRI